MWLTSVKTALVILDGMGLADDPVGNAVTPNSMPFIFAMMAQHGYARLAASGEAVGLRKNIVGNSEVGHLTIGAGTVVPSTLSRMDQAYDDSSWKRNPLWRDLVSGQRCHIVGLLSDAGVHGHLDTLWRSAELAIANGCPRVVVHPVLDGVDSLARSAPGLLRFLMKKLSAIPNTGIGMVVGRKWFCDRSGSITPAERFVDAFSAVHELPGFSPDDLDSLENERDFLPHGTPDVIGACAGEPVLLSSHRGDRAVQVARVMSRKFRVFAPIVLDDAVGRERAFFPSIPLERGLALELANAGMKTTRIAEQCKFPHVTSFFDGLNDDIESQNLSIPTPAEADLPDHPEMAVEALVDTVVHEIEAGSSDLLVVNIANLDQIGHLGRLDLAMIAARKVDTAARRLSDAARANGWTTLFVADHGNADRVETPNGQPYGSHTDRPVPLIAIPSPKMPLTWRKKEGSLANVASTVLASLKLNPPTFMHPSLLDFQLREAAAA